MRIRKAWQAWPAWHNPMFDEGDVFFASTAAKARYQALLEWRDPHPDVELMDITVRRAAHRDIELPDEHPIVADLTKRQRGMITHAYGCDRHGNGYRNHYCTDPRNVDALRLAWEFGLFTGPHGEKAYGETPGWAGAFFYLTAFGKDVARSMLPTYPGEAA